MKKIIPALFFLLQIVPALQIWVPRIAPLCAACEATNHELCAEESHHCSRPAMKKSCSRCDTTAMQPQAKINEVRNGNSDRIGHKCPSADYKELVNSNPRVLSPRSRSLDHPALIFQATSQNAALVVQGFNRGIDRPPPAS